MYYIYKYKNGKTLYTRFKLYFLFCFIFLLAGCSVHKNIIIEAVTENELMDYYQSNNVPLTSVLIIADKTKYQNIMTLNLNVIPDIKIFNKEGNQIEYDHANNCNQAADNFLSNYKVSNEYKTSNNLMLSDYVSNFTSFSKKKFDVSQPDINLYVFVNTALYAKDINKEKFVLEKFKNKNVKIYYVSLDVIK